MRVLDSGRIAGDGGIVVGRGGGGSRGVAGSDAVSAPKETSASSSSCGMAPIRTAYAPLCPLVGWTGCGRFRFRLAGGAGGDGLGTAPGSRRSNHILPGGGAHAPCRSLSCRQRRHCGLAIGGRNCCLGRWCSFRCCCCTLP
jgi:hypothetical protein